MSDNPTLWVSMTYDEWERDQPSDFLYDENREVLARPASRADVLAALPDKEWFCARPKDAIGYVCTYYRPCGSECHWAVKP